MVMKMNKEKLLEEYIEENYADIIPLTERQKTMVEESFSFQGYLLRIAWEELKSTVKGLFPFNLLYGEDKK